MSMIGWRAVALSMLACAGMAPAEARQFTALYNFTGAADGANPREGTILLGGNLYGVTANGGSLNGGGTGCGTVFKIDAHTGAETTLHVFGCNNGLDGSGPNSNLVYHRGRLYGTTGEGGLGELHFGTVFSVVPATGAETVVYSFSEVDIVFPGGGVTLHRGVLYGGAEQGENSGIPGGGAVFGVDLATGQIAGGVPLQCVLQAGNVTGPVSFVAKSVFGVGSTVNSPQCAGGLLQNGAVFKFSLDNATALYSFKGAAAQDGAGPVGSLVVLPHAIYGATVSGGLSGCGVGGCGTVYMVTPHNGHETILHRFSGGADGTNPVGGLTLMGGVLYGTTVADGANGAGTIFVVTPVTGTYQKQYDFVGGTDGSGPGPLYAGNGVLYGTASEGGTDGYGTVFKLRP